MNIVKKEKMKGKIYQTNQSKWNLQIEKRERREEVAEFLDIGSGQSGGHKKKFQNSLKLPNE